MNYGVMVMRITDQDRKRPYGVFIYQGEDEDDTDGEVLVARFSQEADATDKKRRLERALAEP